MKKNVMTKTRFLFFAICRNIFANDFNFGFGLPKRIRVKYVMKKLIASTSPNSRKLLNNKKLNDNTLYLAFAENTTFAKNFNRYSYSYRIAKGIFIFGLETKDLVSQRK